MPKISSCTNILRLIHQNNDNCINNLIEFRATNPSISWCDISYKDTGDTILHVAARLGKEDVVNYIINTWEPKSVDILNKDCKTPLHEAAQFSQPFVAIILLENGAKVNAIKRADWTPLMLACTKKGENSFKTVQFLILRGANVKFTNKDGWNALHIACRTGDSKILLFLLSEYDGNIEERTKNGRTALHIACLHGNANIVKHLLDFYDLDVNVQDNCGSTPFLDAVCSNNIDIIKMLLPKGANHRVKNQVGLNGLHIAASSGLAEILEYLIVELKFNPNLSTPNNMTALHYAAKRQQIEAIEILTKYGADCNIKDIFGRTYNNYLDP